MVKTNLISINKKTGKKVLRNTIDKSLNYSTIDGGFFSVMVGFG